MKKYPFIKQEGIKDCGPACLLMIIKYYKGYVPLEELRALTKTTKLGTDAYHLVESAKEIGFRVKAFKGDLKEDILLPAIVHVTLENKLDHYVVLYKINFKRGYVIVGDPATCIRRLKIEEFELIWNHILIELIPIRTMPFNEQSSFISFLLEYLKPYKRTLFVLFLSSLLISLFSSISAFYFRGMVDSINTSKKFLLKLFIVFFIIHTLKISMDFIRNKIFIRFKQSMELNMSCDVFSKLIDLPYQYYHNHTTGEMISRFEDLEHVRSMLERVIFTIFSDFPLMIVSFIILCLIDLSLTLMMLIIILLYFLCSIVFKSIFRKGIQNIQEKNAETTSLITEALTGFETIQNCSLKERVKEKFDLKYYKLLEENEKISNWINRRTALTETVYQVGVLMLLFLGTLKVVDGNLSIGNLIMFYSVFISFLEPLKNVIQMDFNWNEAKSALKRMTSLFVSKKEQGLVSKIKNFDLACNNLTFYYHDVDLVLKNINLKIKQGEKVLITGKSGSGKSTLLKILMKYYEIPSGQIKIDNIDINHYTSEAIHQSTGYLSSREWLFTGSILDNLGDENLDKVLDISEMCEIDRLMKGRDLSFYSIIEENGFNLSGGERQRIALGRFLLKGFEVLLIDEGMNQMDVNLERRVLKRIFEKYASKTIIIVSHRFDNADLFDRVIELDKGKIRKDVRKNETSRVVI